MITDKLFIDIIGDRKRGESLIKFAVKKLYELPLVRGQNTSRKIQLPGGEIVFVQHTDIRQEIRIFVPGGETEENRKKEYEVVKEFGLFVFWGLPWEVLTVSNATKRFLPNEAVVCGDGSGHTTYVQGNKLIGQYVKCWEEGDSVKGARSGAKATIDTCNSMEYQYTYTSYSLWSNFTFKAGHLVSSPADIFKRMCRDNLNKEFRTHTKVLGNPYHGWMTLTAVENQDLAQFGLDMRFWFLCAKYNGRQVSFETEGNYNTASVMRNIGEHPAPILFDLFYWAGEEDEDETFYCGECHGNIILRRFDKKTSTFKTVVNNPVILRVESVYGSYSMEETLQGYANIKYYVARVTLGQDKTLGFLLTKDVTGEILDRRELEDFDFKFHDFLWNHSNETLYAAWDKTQEQAEPDEPYTIVECEGINKWVTGVWYVCYYSCAGSYDSCNCWVCYDPATACAEPDTFVTVDGSVMAGETKIEWSVQIACCEEYAGNVMTFWTTYHTLTYYPPLVTVKPAKFIITPYNWGSWSRKKWQDSFEGDAGSQTKADAVYCARLVDGGYNGTVPCTDNDAFCEGELTTYAMNKWVFTYDGWYAEMSITQNECNDTKNRIEHIGDKAYAPFASDPPHDHNWTLIIKEETEDIDGEPIDPALFYTDTEAVYYDTGGGLNFAGHGNRAFCCADISTMRREVK